MLILRLAFTPSHSERFHSGHPELFYGTRILFRYLLVFTCVTLLASSLALGQATVGVQKFGAYDGFPDTVDVGSLGLHLEMPLFNKAGRGNGTAVTFTLNNYLGFPTGFPLDAVYNVADGSFHYLNVGPSPSFGLAGAGSLSSTDHTSQCRAMPGSGTFTDSAWTYVDAHGNSHLFPGSSRTVSDSNNTCSAIAPQSLTAQASDGSGYLIQVVPGISYSVTVTAPSGTVDFGNHLTDSNGNILTAGSPNLGGCPNGTAQLSPRGLCLDNRGNIISDPIQDTVNTSIQVSGGGYSADYKTRFPLLLTYLDDHGDFQTITFNYKVYKLGINADAGLLDNVTYPDGSAYRFAYAVDSAGTLTTNPATIASITLPSGGVISYSYPGGITTCGSNPTYVPSLTRTTADGSTTYTRTITSEFPTSPPHCGISTSFTQVTKPNGDRTNVYFVVPQHYVTYQGSNGGIATSWLADLSKTMETKRVEYDHSNLSTPIRTSARCYNGSTGDCTSTTFNEPVTQLAVTTTLDNGQTSKIVTQYTGVSLPTEVDEYDFGSSTATRKTVTTYASLGNNISDRPASVIVYDAAGNIAKKTTYVYDEATPTPMTLPGHTTVSGSRGNLTSVYHWIVSSGQSLRTQYAYDDAGQITSIADPKSNVTSYAYDTTTDAYRTKFTRPTTNSVAHISTFGYGPNSGLLTSAYDENNQLTSYVYDSVFRPSSITYPDGGQTTFSYTPTSKTTNRLMQTGIWNTNVEQYDNYGRIAQTQLTTDPGGTDFTATAYDSLGRAQNVYNRTRCNPPTTNCGEPTWGVTSYQYDALGRTTKVTQPDGNTVLTTYTGRATQVQDEGNGSQRVTRISQTDALSRLRSVCEVASGPFVGTGGSQSSSLIGSAGTPTACGLDIQGTGFLTSYQYDALDNLTQVSQSGVGPRQFNYDSLSRLSSTTNPESGTTCYGTYSAGVCQGNGYDPNSNLVTKVDARGITTTFGYDALNRLLSKGYSDSTPGITNTYDAAVDGLSILNPVGRLVKTATSDLKTATVNSYDQVGRLKNQWQCTPQNCGTGYFSLPYGYDLMGNITSAGNGMGVTIGYGFNNAAELNSVTSSLSDGTHPPTLLSSVNYNPLGMMSSTALGNGATESFGYNSRARLQNISTNGATGSTGSATLTGSEQSIPGAPAAAGTGAVTFNGTLQSKQVQMQTAVAGTGSITVAGSENTAGTPSTGWVSISGAERSRTIVSGCPPAERPCPSNTYYDYGTVTVSVNGSSVSTSYGYGDTPSSVASRLASAINGTNGYYVTASASGSAVNLTSKAWNQNFALSASSTTTYTLYFTGTSFPVTTSGSSLTGGSGPTYDTGRVSITVNGFTASFNYGQNDTTSSIASGLVTYLASSSVNASASGAVITLTAKTTGAATNYSLSTSVAYDTGHFSTPSFTASPSGPTLTGGRDAAYNTVYDSGNSTITANGHSNTVGWSGSGTTTSSIASALAANINADSAASVTATASGSAVNLTSKTTGAGTNYSLSSSSSYDSGNFSSASFTTSNSGSTLTGGHDAGATTYDAGSVWITVSGTRYSVSYGQGSTPASLANSLAQAINGSPASPVNATASSTTISLASKEGGSSTNYSLSVGSSTSQGASFTQPSFTLTASGSTMTGGATGSIASVYNVALAYAPNGNVNSANDTVNGNWLYGYDPFNRVVSANQNNGQAVYSYVYDIAGNRWQQNGPHSSQLGFDTNNRITGVTGIGYDSSGNMTSDGSGTGTHSYSYDAENRIVQVDGTLGNCSIATACYVYDAEGRRVRKTTAGQSVDFLYDFAGHQVAEVSSAGGWNRGEIYAGGRHLATYWNSTTYFNHRDWLGTERLRTNVGGGTYETCTSLVFGDWLTCSNSDSSPMHFTGQEHDFESGLDNFGARYDTSSMGRFMSPDPGNAGGMNDDPQSWNAYAYAGNNPLLYTDPDGKNYLVCGSVQGNSTKSNNCADLTQEQYDQFRKDNPNLRVTPSGDIYTINDNGTETKTGSATYYDEKNANAAAHIAGVQLLINEFVKQVAINVAIGAIGRGIGLGIEAIQASRAANAAAEAAEAANLAAKAAQTVGNQGAVASSKAAAMAAGEEFVGPGAQTIVDRTTGQVAGKISADGSKVYRITSINKAQPYVNLENKATGGNLHVRF